MGTPQDLTPEERINLARPFIVEYRKKGIKIIPIKKDYHTAANKKRSEERRKRREEKGGKRSFARNRKRGITPRTTRQESGRM
jgi:hypothetical protein